MRIVDTDSRECGFKRIKCEKEGDGFFFYCADELTHKLTVLAADGKPLREGETVWDTETAEQMHVCGFENGYVITDSQTWGDKRITPSVLTHERPDSWERLEEDCGMFASEYAEKFDLNKEAGGWGVPVRRDLVRRAKKLAGVER